MLISIKAYKLHIFHLRSLFTNPPVLTMCGTFLTKLCLVFCYCKVFILICMMCSGSLFAMLSCASLVMDISELRPRRTQKLITDTRTTHAPLYATCSATTRHNSTWVSHFATSRREMRRVVR